jgi:uncharacterized membrane protein YoaK (UPF0700 family)
MVGAGTAALGWIRVRLAGEGEREDSPREAAAMIGSVLALYALTALVREQPDEVALLLVYAVALVIVAAFARRPADLACAALAAVAGVGTEVVLAAAGVFEYADDISRVAGVAGWLPGLYLAYGVVAGRLGMVAARRL